jgi:hypothetical protein
MTETTALVLWQPEFPLWAQAEQRQIEAWAAADVLLCPFTSTPCDCRQISRDERCL